MPASIAALPPIPMAAKAARRLSKTWLVEALLAEIAQPTRSVTSLIRVATLTRPNALVCVPMTTVEVPGRRSALIVAGAASRKILA
jgi:hypothetical protein